MLTTPIVPRPYETDAAGHINNVFVPAWFEAGRREIFRMFTPSLGFDDWRVVLVSMQVDYLAQLYFEHEAEVRTFVDHVGTKSFRLYEEIRQRGETCARGTATYVCFDYARQVSQPIPADVAARLREHARASG